jgi:germination protein M
VTRRGVLSAVGAAALVLLGAWALTRGLERLMTAPERVAERAESAPPEQAPPVRHITATLFYGSADGQWLVPVQREVPFGDTPVSQGRHIVQAQLEQPATTPLVGLVPPGSTLRNFYVTDQGDAFVDLGPEIVAEHPGGSAAELLTVYAVVNAVTANLPAITRVQILVDGKEVDSLVGHVDLRRPLQRNDALVRQNGTQ